MVIPQNVHIAKCVVL